MRKVTLLSALCLIGCLALPMAQTFAQTPPPFKYTQYPNLPVTRGNTVVHSVYVNHNVRVADVRIALHANVVMYSSLRIELISPGGTTLVLKDNQPAGNEPWYGSMGTSDSYCLFRDGGISFTGATAPNDFVFQPVEFLSLINGENAQGWWTLKLIDEAATNAFSAPQGGTWNAWVLMFNEIIEEPELVLYDQLLVGPSLVPQINGRTADGAIIPNWHDDGDACPGGVYTLGRNGDCFPFIVNGINGMIGDPVPPLVTPGRFEIEVNITTNYLNGPFASAYTSDISVFFGQAVENFSGTLPAPPGTYPNPTVASQWPTGLATTTSSLYPGPNGLNGGVMLVACPTYPALASDDLGGMSGVTFRDPALIGIEAAPACSGIDGLCGEFKPMQSLSSMNGARAINGLYYVTIYDTYGDNESQLKNSTTGEQKIGHVRVLSLRLRYLAGGGDAQSPSLHQGIAGPLMGVPTPGPIDGAIVGYRTSVGNTIPPYSQHGVLPTTNPSEREPILYFTNIQKMYPANSVGYLHEELINVSNGSWQPVGNHGPIAFPGALDINESDPFANGNSSFADVLQIPNGWWKMRQKLVHARYDADPSDNEAVGPDFHVTPNTFAYYDEKVPAWSLYNNPEHTGFLVPGVFGNGEGAALAFTLFQFPSTKIVSVDLKLEGLGNGPTPQSAFVVVLWPAEFGLTGAPSGNPVAISPTIGPTQYIPGQTDGNWRTIPLYPLTPNGGPDLTTPAVDLEPGTYFVTVTNVGNSDIPFFPYEFGQAPTLKDRILDYHFTDDFGPLGPFSTLGSRMSYISTDPTSPPSLAWGETVTQVMSNFTLAMKLNMDYMSDFAVDYVTFDGTLGNESVSLPNAPFQPTFYVSSRTLQNGQPADCNIDLKIYQGPNWSSGTNKYVNNQVVTLLPFETVPVLCNLQWNPPTGGLYHVEASISHSAPQDANPVNNIIKFDVNVNSTVAIIAKGKNAGMGQVNDLQSLLENRGHDVKVVDMNDATLAKTSDATVYVVGDVSGSSMIQTAANNGNRIAIYGQKGVKTVATIDKIYGVERTGAYSVDEATFGMPVNVVGEPTPVKIDPIKIDVKSKEELLGYINSNPVSNEDVILTTPRAEVIQAERDALGKLLPPVKYSPVGEITYLSEKETGIVYAIPSVEKAGAPVEETASVFTLEQNFPNPFNPSTNISYTLQEDAQVTLRVLDLLGQEVTTLVSAQKDAGTYTVTFNGTDNAGNVLASGNYVYRIDVVTATGNTYTNTKKMTLAK